MTQLKSIVSIGKLAGEIQLPVQSITAITARHGIEPAILINGVAHFDDAAAERIASLAWQQRKEKAANV